MLPRKPSNLSAKVKCHTAILNWEQEFTCQKEKATKYDIQVADHDNLSRLIDHTFGDTSPSQCEHKFSGLTPGQTYTVVITAGNDSGITKSEEFCFYAPCESISQVVFTIPNKCVNTSISAAIVRLITY